MSKPFCTTTDHLGNRFQNKEQMCEHYGVKYGTFYSRIKRGLTLEEALTKPVQTGIVKPTKDHLGNVFHSTAKMCRHYGVDYYVFTSRRRRGWTIQEALMEPKMTAPIIRRKHKVYDHKGNQYISLAQMCRAYGVSYTRTLCRIRRGWNIEQALAQNNFKKGGNLRKNVVDPSGKTHCSITEMCKENNIPYNVYTKRIARGASMEEALSTPYFPRKRSEQRKDFKKSVIIDNRRA